MFAKNEIKKKLIKEIDQLPEDAFESVYHILHHLRLELTKREPKSPKSFSDKFLKTFGSWKDNRPARQIMEEIYNSRFFSKKNIEW